jgi:hypothetical protein
VNKNAIAFYLQHHSKNENKICNQNSPEKPFIAITCSNWLPASTFSEKHISFYRSGFSRNSRSSLVWSTVPTLSLNNQSTTSVTSDLQPNTSGTRNFGSSTLRWNLGYFNVGVVLGNTTVTTAGMIRYNADNF